MKVSKLTDSELIMLKHAKSELDWRIICGKIKGKRRGEYPADWYEKASKLFDEISKNWNRR